MKLPETWVVARFTDICQLNPGLGMEEHPDEDLDVTFVPMSAVDEHRGTIARPETRKYGEVAKGYTVFRDGDVMFAKVTPCMENGKAALAQDLTNGFGFGSTEFHVFRPSEAVLPEYLFHFVRQQTFRTWAASSVVGTGGLKRVPPQFFERIKVLLPTLPEQRRIIDVLRQAEAVNDAKRSIAASIDKLVSTAYWSYFSDWYQKDGLRDPVRISTCLADTQYGISDAMQETGSHAVLRMNSLTTSGWLDLTDLKYADVPERDAEATRLDDGDLLFNRTNSRDLVGKCAIWRHRPEQISFASYLVRLRLKEGMLPEYLWATLNSAYGKYRLLNAAKQAVSMANVSPTDLGRITVPLPPLPLQQRFAELVRSVETLRTRALSRVGDYQDLLDLIIHRAMLGELTEGWRQDHRAEIEAAARERDALLSSRGVKGNRASPESAARSMAPPTAPGRPARQWLMGELSDFQRRLMDFFLTYTAETARPLLTEDPDAFSAFCEDDRLVEALAGFEQVSPNRIGRTLSQLAELGLIAKVTLVKPNVLTGQDDYLKAFRPLRDSELRRLEDLEQLHAVLAPDAVAEPTSEDEAEP